MKTRSILNMTIQGKHFDPSLSKDENKERRSLIESELRKHLNSGELVPLELVKSFKNKKECYQAKIISKTCILNYLNVYFSRKLNVKVSNRNEIIRRLKSLLLDCSPLTVIRADISSFYEKIDREELFRLIIKKESFPKREINFLKQFFNELDRHGIKGLPRGISLSSTLSEYYLKEFDDSCNKLDTIFFRARYVDDIIIVGYSSKMSEGGLDFVKSALPDKLFLNMKKTKRVDIPKASDQKGGNNLITFLGYDFIVKNKKNNDQREVDIFMSKNKINEYKRKTSISFKTFEKNSNSIAFKDLYQRVNYLTGNIVLPNDNDNRLLKSGVYYNYPEITENEDNGLYELDRFLKMLIYSSGCRISKASTKLTLTEKRKLSKFSFLKGHKMKFLRNIDLDELMKVTRVFK